MHQLTGPLRPATLVRLGVPFAILAGCIWLLSDIIDPELLTELPGMLMSMKAEVLMMSALLCALSFWAVARYDEVAHRHFQTGVDPVAARHSGFAAIAMGQTIGFGIFTGAIVRWRVLPCLKPLQALQLSSFAALTFMPALFFFTALINLMFLPISWWSALALCAVLAMPAIFAVLSFAPICAALRTKGVIPSVRAMGAIMSWTILDVVTAAAAIFLLLPASTIGFEQFLPVFLLALSAALLSGSPGGVGPFEIVLIALLPQIPMADLLVAIVCFRALYYAVPAILAVTYLLRPCTTAKTSTAPAPRPFDGTLPAEMGMLSQNNGIVASFDAGALGLLPTAQTITQVFDPVDLHLDCATAYLSKIATCENKLPLVYKCSAGTALGLRKMDWRIWRIAQDAILDVGSYDLSTPSRRRLRRSLRQADKAGLRVVHQANLPIAQMAQLDSAWQALHGAAQGTTMGRFSPAYVAEQEVFLAYLGNQLVGFASFHRNADSLCLDLMRHAKDLPQGSMHALVQSAIDFAQHAKLSTVSLAAVPDVPKGLLSLPGMRQRFDRSGLLQFKNSFAPQWCPRYAAAPSFGALIIGLADMTLAIHCPAPLITAESAHNQDEDYEVDLTTPACDSSPLANTQAYP